MSGVAYCLSFPKNTAVSCGWSCRRVCRFLLLEHFVCVWICCLNTTFPLKSMVTVHKIFRRVAKFGISSIEHVKNFPDFPQSFLIFIILVVFLSWVIIASNVNCPRNVVLSCSALESCEELFCLWSVVSHVWCGLVVLWWLEIETFQNLLCQEVRLVFCYICPNMVVVSVSLYHQPINIEHENAGRWWISICMLKFILRFLVSVTARNWWARLVSLRPRCSHHNLLSSLPMLLLLSLSLQSW